MSCALFPIFASAVVTDRFYNNREAQIEIRLELPRNYGGDRLFGQGLKSFTTFFHVFCIVNEKTLFLLVGLCFHIVRIYII